MIGGMRRPGDGSARVRVVVLTAAAAALAGGLAAISPPVALVVVGGVIVVTYLGETARRPLGEVLMVGMIAISGGVDLLQQVNTGVGSLQAVETLAFVVLAVLVCITGLTIPVGPAGRALGLLAIFVLWTLVSFSWGTAATQGYQNTLVFVAALLFMAIAVTVIQHRGRAAYEVVSKAFWVAAVVGLGLYAAGVAIAGPGTDKILSPRPFGLMAVVLVAWFLGAGMVRRRWAYWVVGAAIVLTLRVAVALGVRRAARAGRAGVVRPAELPRMADRDRRRGHRDRDRDRRGVPVRPAAPPLLPRRHRQRRRLQPERDRPRRAVVGELGLVQATAADRPRRGASDRLTDALPFHGAGHPHNDYLRILVDYGIVGFVLWITAYLALLRLTWKRWQAVRGTHVFAEHIHAAAFLVLVGIALTMIVDNPMIELARMAPLGILVGMSLGLPSPVSAEEAGAAPAPIPAMAAR